MRNFGLIVGTLAAAGLGLGSLIPAGDSGALHAQPARGPTRPAIVYVAKAGAADLYEIESSRMAVRRARRPEVREFAQMLIAEHNRTTAQVMAAARADGIRPAPAMLEPSQRTMIRQLSRVAAGGFDRAYMNQQVVAHQQALTLHRNYARRGVGNDLRRVAAGAVPVIEGHLAQARRLARGR